MKRLKIPFLCNNRAVSYTISAIIITTTTITLVLVASIYTYQILEQQKAAAEFESAKKSILAFNDVLENVAWKPKAALSSRFTIEYGHLELTPDVNTIRINATVGNSTWTLFSNTTGFVKYWISNKYVTFGQGYELYILGNSSIIVGNTGSYGRAVIKQQTGWVTITLDYRVRAMKTSVIQVNGENVNYIDIWVIKLKIDHWRSYIHEFDLKARCIDVSTTAYGPYPINSEIEIEVQYGSQSSEIEIEELDPGKVVFNVIVAQVQLVV